VTLFQGISAPDFKPSSLLKSGQNHVEGAICLFQLNLCKSGKQQQMKGWLSATQNQKGGCSS
jgi:hypothetical protein